jgi:hypothetical protein
VRYDKGDRDGNKWLSDTPFLINWNRNAVDFLKQSNNARYQGVDFYFKSGFSWSCINGTRNTNNLKFKFIYPSVNDVQGMKLSLNSAASHLLSEKYVVCMNNSFLVNRLSESFINFTVAFQINDTRQIPIIIPTKDQLKAFEKKYDQCFVIQEEYFAGEIDKTEARNQLRPIEAEIDEMVNKLYGVEAKEEIALDELEDEFLEIEIPEEDEDF